MDGNKRIALSSESWVAGEMEDCIPNVCPDLPVAHFLLPSLCCTALSPQLPSTPATHVHYWSGFSVFLHSFVSTLCWTVSHSCMAFPEIILMIIIDELFLLAHTTYRFTLRFLMR